jgi:hypothetical protein
MSIACSDLLGQIFVRVVHNSFFSTYLYFSCDLFCCLAEHWDKGKYCSIVMLLCANIALSGLPNSTRPIHSILSSVLVRGEKIEQDRAIGRQQNI